MLLLKSLVFTLLVCFGISSEVLYASDETFNDLILNSEKASLVKVYADWCRHCKQLAPEFEELAEIYSEDPNVQIAEVNGDKGGKKITKKYNIEGFPTVLFFEGRGKLPVEYHGDRKAAAYNNFIRAMLDNVEAPVENCVVPELNDVTFSDAVSNKNYEYSVVAFLDYNEAESKRVSKLIDDVSCRIYTADSIQVAKVFVDKSVSANMKQSFAKRGGPSVILFKTEELPKFTDISSASKSLLSLVLEINEKTGFQRDLAGDLPSGTGNIEEFDNEIKAAISGGYVTNVGVELLGKFEQFLATSELDIPEEVSAYYNKLINKIVNGETGFYVREKTRLGKILGSKENVNRRSLDYMQKRYNILDVFLDSTSNN